MRRGEVRKVSRGRFVLADLESDRLSAAQVGGVVSHLSAAVAHGWEVKSRPQLAWVTVRRNAHPSPEAQATRHISFAHCQPDEVDNGVTRPLRTVLDCARKLPFDEALAVADSALRHGAITVNELLEGAARVRGKGAQRARLVAEHADALAANPFESVLRALIIESGHLAVQPQLAIAASGRVWHPDLVDVERRIIFEADSWTFHATRDGHGRDCVRYNALAMAGWLVLRFTWEQVMLSPTYVRSVLDELSSLAL